MVWVYVALVGLVVLEVTGLRRFYAVWGRSHQLCHCGQPWRGEYVANFGHPPEDVRQPEPLTLRRTRRLATRRLIPAFGHRQGPLRPAAS
jgi:hypothetical protein